MTRLSRILIAEDDHTIAHVVQRVLEDTQLYQVTWVTDGDGVLEHVAQYRPDLILLDLMMPRRNGFEVCRAIREVPESRDIPICIMTALTDDQAHQTARAAGANDILMKPFRAGGLREVVRRLLPERESVEEPAPVARVQRGGVPSWSHLIAEYRSLLRLVEQETPTYPSKEAHLGRFRRLIEQSERRLTDTLAETQSNREVDLRLRFHAWQKQWFEVAAFVDESVGEGDNAQLYLSEVDTEILAAFLESLRFDMSTKLAISGLTKLSARRNGQTLIFRCVGNSARDLVAHHALSPLSVSLSQLLGASLSLENGKDGSFAYLIYFRASRNLLTSRQDHDGHRLEMSWSGLVVSVQVIIETPRGQVQTSLKALGGRGGLLESNPSLEQALADSDGKLVALSFPEFGGCDAKGILHRRAGEWAILWRDVGEKTTSVLREIRQSAPGGGFFDD